MKVNQSKYRHRKLNQQKSRWANCEMKIKRKSLQKLLQIFNIYLSTKTDVIMKKKTNNSVQYHNRTA